MQFQVQARKYLSAWSFQPSNRSRLAGCFVAEFETHLSFSSPLTGGVSDHGRHAV